LTSGAGIEKGLPLMRLVLDNLARVIDA